MSRFSVYVFTSGNGGSAAELLRPYDEGFEVDPYIAYTREQAITEIRGQINAYIIRTETAKVPEPGAVRVVHALTIHDSEFDECPEMLAYTDEQCYQEARRRWYDPDDPDGCFDENGNLLSVSNPNARWSLCRLGGMWDGGLMTRSGERVNEGYASEIDWEKTNYPFAFITPDGQWHEKGELGRGEKAFMTAVLNEKRRDDWKREFMNAVTGLSEPDVRVALFDCYMYGRLCEGPDIGVCYASDAECENRQGT
ncbi:MAG: hypothetical protein E7425_13915 [Ruminococcaceae bacterium]|nr:hypothetical protein [Oscillospiraceae bacterium]